MSDYLLPALQVAPRRGDEKFMGQEGPLPFGVLDFWRWMGSDLVNNAMRGILAEYIVAQALGCVQEVRMEWDACDLRTAEGLAIEVKSAAYCQSWEQDRLSTIGFDIAPKVPDNIPGNDRKSEARRPAQVYVFCVLYHEDKATIDPLILDQWEFYVLPTRVLDAKVPTQKSISLSSLKRLEPKKVAYGALRQAVEISGAHPVAGPLHS